MKNFELSGIEKFTLCAIFAFITPSYCYGDVTNIEKDSHNKICYDYAIRMSFAVHMSNRVNNPNLPEKYKWIKNSKYRDTIYKVIYDAMFGSGNRNISFDNGVAIFKGTDPTKYTLSEWNAVLLYSLLKSPVKTESYQPYRETERMNTITNKIVREITKSIRSVQNVYSIWDIACSSSPNIDNLIEIVAGQIEKKYSLKKESLSVAKNNIKQYFEALDIMKWMKSYVMYNRLNALLDKYPKETSIQKAITNSRLGLIQKSLGITIAPSTNNQDEYILCPTDTINMNTDGLNKKLHGKKCKLMLHIAKENCNNVVSKKNIYKKSGIKNSKNKHETYYVNEYMEITTTSKTNKKGWSECIPVENSEGTKGFATDDEENISNAQYYNLQKDVYTNHKKVCEKYDILYDKICINNTGTYHSLE